MSFYTTEEQIYEIFSKCGEVGSLFASLSSSVADHGQPLFGFDSNISDTGADVNADMIRIFVLIKFIDIAVFENSL